MKLSYLDLATTDPAYNLAMEQYVFDCLPKDRSYFMLWQNDNAIIIGKYQNTQAEINEDFVRQNGIRVVRRLSGGGAVYHDMGNLNFTFITDADHVDRLNFHLFCQPVIRLLQKLGAAAAVDGRNDMTINGKKFSGNSQYLCKGRVLHHGTILFDSNLSVIEKALKVDSSKIKTKGIRSVHSRVTNVLEHLPEKISIDQFRKILLNMIRQESHGDEYLITPADIAQVEELRVQRYSTWEWNYGISPECTFVKKQRVEGCGMLEVYITVDHGIIEKVNFRGDFFSITDPNELSTYLLGCKPEPAEYKKALTNVDISQYFMGMDNDTFIQILCQ